MRTRRTVATVAVLALIAAGCGGGSTAAPEASPSTTTTLVPPPTTTQPPTTTRPPTTTTVPPTTSTTVPPTTTTVPPWMALTVPDMPPGVWDAGSGDPVEITSLCLDWVLAGTSPPNQEIWESSLTDKLAVLGVGVVPDGCDATLRFSLTASRTSAVYGINRMVCWNGEALETEASLIIDGDTEHTWHLGDRESPPPDSIIHCDQEDSPVYPTQAEEIEWWDTLFSDMFGIGAALATWIEDSPDDGPACWEDPPTEADVQALSSLLVSAHFGAARDWLSQCLPADQAGKEALRPLIPYLIVSSSGEILEALTGSTFATREEWWAWWEEQQ